ncbi:MAG: FG-GAP repeat protein [Lysobacterales bacterium]
MLTFLLVLLATVGHAQPTTQFDLLSTPDSADALTRVYGSSGTGRAGLPVAGGGDVDGDGFADFGFAAFQAPVGALVGAGRVYLVFGDGTIGGSLDTSAADPAILNILGTQASEHTGSEIWMDDVTGDGLADLLVCRQDHTPIAGRTGAGALTIVVGNPALKTLAQSNTDLDLSAPPVGITLFTVFGADVQDRMCMWARTGDVTGDGIADIVVGADQFGSDQNHLGRVYVIRGGVHLNQVAAVDAGQSGQPGFVLAGNLAQISSPVTQLHAHFGATVQVADLDGNGRAEVLAATALNRAGGSLGPSPRPERADGSGGTPDGTVYIIWDDNFPAGVWANPFEINVNTAAGATSAITGATINSVFGEEMLGGLDFDNNGSADLFVGDLTGGPPGRGTAGLGHVLYDAAGLKNLTFDLDSPPVGVVETRIYGPVVGAIGADTAMQGDFDADGIDDLAFSSPHDAPFGRQNAGTVHVMFGQAGRWPALIDLAPEALPPPSQLRLTEVYGARGNIPGDTGDTLAYSGAAGDINGDGRTDILTNEMVGNGIAPNTVDVGNLIILSGSLLAEPLFADGFEE